MKKIILFLSLIAATYSFTRAQALLIDPSSFNLTIELGELGDALSTVTNNTNASRDFRWVRETVVQPANWSTVVCDITACWSPMVSSMDFTLGPGEEGFLRMDIFTNDYSGEGEYRLLVYDINDSASVNGIITINAALESTGINGVGQEVISVYPNPVKEVLYLTVNSSLKISTIEIFNVVGQKMKTINLEGSLQSVSVPVADLKKGVYFLRASSNGKEVITRTFSKD